MNPFLQLFAKVFGVIILVVLLTAAAYHLGGPGAAFVTATLAAAIAAMVIPKISGSSRKPLPEGEAIVMP